MTGWSIRTRLTVWYLAVIVPATIALAIGSWWLARRSLNDEVDRTLAARLEGTREFLEAMAREGLHGDEMKEEFGEYVELSRGAVLLEVTDAAGTVLSRPSRPGWAALADEASLAAIPSAAPVDRVESGEPFRVARATIHAGAAEYRAVVATSTRASHDALRRFAWLLGGLAPAVLLIAGLGGYWIAGRALAPVDRMTRTVQETTLRSLDRRLEVPAADDELRRLAVTFNEMLARMQVGVADLTRLTAEASHELRTPVSLVRTTAEIALSRPRPGRRVPPGAQGRPGPRGAHVGARGRSAAARARGCGRRSGRVESCRSVRGRARRRRGVSAGRRPPLAGVRRLGRDRGRRAGRRRIVPAAVRHSARERRRVHAAGRTTSTCA